jgi:hypothetical protein
MCVLAKLIDLGNPAYLGNLGDPHLAYQHLLI